MSTCGLVTAHMRSYNGFRLYSTDELEQLRLAKILKPMNLSIDEMRDILSTAGPSAEHDVATKSPHECLDLAAQHVNQLEQRALAAREAYSRLRGRLEEPLKH